MKTLALCFMIAISQQKVVSHEEFVPLVDGSYYVINRTGARDAAGRFVETSTSSSVDGSASTKKLMAESHKSFRARLVAVSESMGQVVVGPKN